MTHGLYILLAIGGEARHGYAIMREIREATGGRVEILPGTLYATIKTLLADRLVQEGPPPNPPRAARLIRGLPPPKDPDSAAARRRYYRVTKAGRAVAAAQTDQMA